MCEKLGYNKTISEYSNASVFWYIGKVTRLCACLKFNLLLNSVFFAFRIIEEPKGEVWLSSCSRHFSSIKTDRRFPHEWWC